MFQITYLATLSPIAAFLGSVAGGTVTLSAKLAETSASQPIGLQYLQAAGQSLSDTYGILTSLVWKHSATCDTVSEIYKVLDFEAEENRKFFESTRSKDEVLEYMGVAIPRSMIGFQSIDSRLAHDCHIQSSKSSDIPQELDEYIQLNRESGNIILRLSGKQPIEVILSALSDIFDKAVRGVNSERNAGASSVGRYLAGTRTATEEMRQLEEVADGRA